MFYKQVSVNVNDKQLYVELAEQLSQEKGVPVSVPAAIKLAVQYFQEHRSVETKV